MVLMLCITQGIKQSIFHFIVKIYLEFFSFGMSLQPFGSKGLLLW